MTIGSKVDVCKIYNRLLSLQAAESELEKCQRTLRAVADLIGPIGPTITTAQQPKESTT